MYVATHAKNFPDKPAVVMAESGEVLTYADLNDESVRLARALRAAGLRPGDRVALAMGNGPRYLVACWAARRTGLYYVPINWHLTAAEMAYVVDNSGATALIADSACADVATKLRSASPALRAAMAVDCQLDGFDDFDQVIKAFPAGDLEHETRGDHIVYTAGTTGRPKGGGFRPLTGAHPSEVDAVAALLRDRHGFNADSVYLTPGAPLYHAVGLRFSLSVTQFGGTNVIMRRFDPEGALQAVERYRVTHSQWVPTMFLRLLRLPEEIRARYDVSSQQTAIHGAAPCPIWAKTAMIDWWGPILTEFYGASDGGPNTMISSAEWLERPGSVGRSTIGRLHVLGDRDEELPAGEVGTIYVEDGLPVAYLDDPEKTRAAHSMQGWATVGDVGYLDEDGYLYLTDRKNDVIISGGVNIYPREIEDTLSQHPAVADVAVIGVPNDDLIEEVKAVVQLVDTIAEEDGLAEDLVAYCRERLARYKCPRSVDFVAELPRSSNGKLYKRRIRDTYWKGRSSRIV